MKIAVPFFKVVPSERNDTMSATPQIMSEVLEFYAEPNSRSRYLHHLVIQTRGQLQFVHHAVYTMSLASGKNSDGG